MMHPLWLILGSIVLNTAGQVAFKKASFAISTGGYISALLTQPFLWIGLACYGFSTLIWLIVLSRASLSYAYPMVAFGYVLVVFASALIFGETISLLRWGAVFWIVSGVALLAFT